MSNQDVDARHDIWKEYRERRGRFLEELSAITRKYKLEIRGSYADELPEIVELLEDEQGEEWRYEYDNMLLWCQKEISNEE